MLPWQRVFRPDCVTCRVRERPDWRADQSLLRSHSSVIYTRISDSHHYWAPAGTRDLTDLQAVVAPLSNSNDRTFFGVMSALLDASLEPGGLAMADRRPGEEMIMTVRA